ncbi:LysR family transcriptional regulator [Achromobacter sp. UMC71]|uniref:LysR family transcriptional regulator n=1 Tax=Achromobacter sp. UMC71 TaxID=1862320 RepID=UPI0015FFD3CE|nr:LysR family transcriptional regulator [Achromobacter sp. UMC71]MBB1627271.1 LysR family transcriptional regulator [Achromobacter sp. UMC71]
MNLSLRDIEYFLAAVEHANLARAAAVCEVSQPALSKSLQRLEADTGLALLDRSGRGLRLTSAGLVFLEHAKKLWVQYQDAVRQALELRVGEAGLLRMGATGATVDSIVMPALAWLLPRRPALRVQLVQGLSDDLNEQVASGKLDLAVTPIYADVPAALHQTPILEDGLCVAASRKHPLAARRKLALHDLQAQRWILPKPAAVARLALDAHYAEAGLALPVAALEVEHFSKGTLALLAQSSLLAIVPQSALADQRGIAALPVVLGRPLQRRIALITRRATTWSPLMAEFRSAVAAVAKG